MPPPRTAFGKRGLNVASSHPEGICPKGYGLSNKPKVINIFFGFTLAEVLITLGVIGVVAAMTLPSLINSGRNKQYEAGFKAAYSIVNQAVTYLHAKDIIITESNFSTANSGQGVGTRIFSEVFAEAFSGIHALNTRLTNEKGTAVISTYKTFSNKTFNAGRLDDGSFELTNGMSVFVETGTATVTPIVIFDINGSRKKPNRLGYDTFAFIIDKDDKILPVGSPFITSSSYSFYKDLNTYCNKTAASAENGMSCAYKAFSENDYFKNLK